MKIDERVLFMDMEGDEAGIICCIVHIGFLDGASGRVSLPLALYM